MALSGAQRIAQIIAGSDRAISRMVMHPKMNSNSVTGVSRSNPARHRIFAMRALPPSDTVKTWSESRPPAGSMDGIKSLRRLVSS